MWLPHWVLSPGEDDLVRVTSAWRDQNWKLMEKLLTITGRGIFIPLVEQALFHLVPVVSQWYHPKNYNFLRMKKKGNTFSKKLLIYRKRLRTVVVLPTMIFIHHMHQHIHVHCVQVCTHSWVTCMCASAYNSYVLQGLFRSGLWVPMVLVSCPDPALSRGKGSGIFRAISWHCWVSMFWKRVIQWKSRILLDHVTSNRRDLVSCQDPAL